MTALSTADTAPHPRQRQRQRTRLVLAVLSAGGIALLAWASLVSSPPRLIYNPSDSVAVGWYRVEPLAHGAAAPRVRSLVLVSLPTAAAALAARRGYLPTGIPLLKPVAAVAPETVCITEDIVRIDGVPVAAVLRADGMGRPLHAWADCRRLRPGELFLLSTTNSASFDSRYFGPVAASAVIGIAHPVWLDVRP